MAARQDFNCITILPIVKANGCGPKDALAWHRFFFAFSNKTKV